MLDQKDKDTILMQAIKQAQEEIDKEDFANRVDEEKIRLRNKKTWWERIFPWNINMTITRR